MNATLARNRRRIVVAAILALVATLTLIASVMSADDRDSLATSTPTGPMEFPDEWMATQRMSDGSTELSAATYDKARDEARNVAIRTRSVYRHLAQETWDFFGPANIGGRVVDIAVDPEVEDQIFIAAASGGVWKSSDAGMTFESVWPDSWVQGMGAVAMTSDGVLFAGSGEAQPGGGSITFGGNGIYRSTDRGETWEHVGLEDSHAIARFAIDPSDEDRIFAAATGNLFVPGGERGVYLSEDGGDSWNRVLAPLNDTTGATEVLIDPDNPDRVYAAMWDHLREPHQRTYGGPGSSLWRSDDGGQTWQRMTDGLPTDDDQGRWGLALAPSNPERMYAYVGFARGDFRAFFRSDDGGDTWTQTPLTAPDAAQSTFSWWFGKIWVDPADQDHVFLAGVDLMRSADGAMSFAESEGVHADQHKMAWDPKVPNRVYLGNDGGMYRSDANGVSRTWAKATHEPYTQFYSVDVAETVSDRKVGGMQDNGRARSWDGENGGWVDIGGGDGLQAIIHPENPDIVFHCSQYGSCARSNNSGDDNINQITSANRGVVWDSGTSENPRRGRNWFSPLQFDPTDPDVMYFGTTHVNRSVNGGLAWEPISGDLTDGGPDDPNCPLRDEPEDYSCYPWGTITTVAAAPTDPNTLYAGTDDGNLWWTDDLGANWNQVDEDQMPGTWVTRVAVHPADEDIAYATFSGFRSGSDRPHVMVTQDGGETWTDIGQGLPDAPVNSVIPTSDGLLLVGTDVGVYMSAWNGGEWAALGSDLPMAAVLYLRYHEPTRQLSAATFGRGIFDLDVPQCRAASTRLPLRDPGVGVVGVLASCRASQQ